LDEADIVTPKTDSPEICFYHLVGMTRKVVDRVGYPRREFFMWMDEIEYSWRIKRAGFTERRIDIPFTHPEKGVFLNDPRAIYYCTRNGLYMLRDYNRYGKLIRFLIATVGINLLRGTMKYALMGISDFLLGKTGKKEYNFKNRAGKLEQRTQRLK
jgi:GT2 family glycosyltransferase